MTVPLLLYGYEKRSLLTQHVRIEAMEIKFLRSVAGCTLNGHKTNEELNVYNLSVVVVV
jgi:hypothetical protein